MVKENGITKERENIIIIFLNVASQEGENSPSKSQIL